MTGRRGNYNFWVFRSFEDSFLIGLFFTCIKIRRKRRQNKGVRDFFGVESFQTERTFGKLVSTQIAVFPRLRPEPQDISKISTFSTRRKIQKTRAEEVHQDTRDQSSPREAWPLSENEVPVWMARARERLLSNYPDDSFLYVQERAQMKIRCMDCTERTFMLGPGLTLNNFEAHLRTPKHRSIVNERLHGESNKLFSF